jgi:hypothetical protein
VGRFDPASLSGIVGRYVHRSLQVSSRAGQAGLEQRIKEICQTRVRYVYRRVHVLLRRRGWGINQKSTIAS